MLTYNQTMEKIKNISAELQALKTKTDTFSHREKLREYKNAGQIEKIKKAEADFLKDAEKEQSLKQCLTVYKSNAEKLYILENIQKVIEIFNNYKGKKCGEKTKEKIKAEAKENGINMYFTHNTIIFCMGLYGYDRKEVYTKYIDGKEQVITDAENKINELSKNMFHLPDAESIIDNVEVYTEQKKAEFLKLKQMYETLEEATKQYNHNNPFKHQYVGEGIYYID